MQKKNQGPKSRDKKDISILGNYDIDRPTDDRQTNKPVICIYECTNLYINVSQNWILKGQLRFLTLFFPFFFVCYWTAFRTSKIPGHFPIFFCYCCPCKNHPRLMVMNIIIYKPKRMTITAGNTWKDNANKQQFVNCCFHHIQQEKNNRRKGKSGINKR